MIIQIDFYKNTGKYYAGGNLTITDDTYLYSDNLEQIIIDNQNIMTDGWQNHEYIVILSDHPADTLSPNYTKFWKRYYNKDHFKGYIKTNNLTDKLRTVIYSK